jgi:hypothetical protein
MGVMAGGLRVRAGTVSWAVDADGQFTTGVELVDGSDAGRE